MNLLNSIFFLTIMLRTLRLHLSFALMKPLIPRDFSRSLTSIAAVKNIMPVEFRDIIKSDSKSLYQIIDVREPSELAVARYPTEVIELPMSSASEWSIKIKNGELLDKEKPTICLCKVGGRSGNMANFLGKLHDLLFTAYFDYLFAPKSITSDPMWIYSGL